MSMKVSDYFKTEPTFQFTVGTIIKSTENKYILARVSNTELQFVSIYNPDTYFGVSPVYVNNNISNGIKPITQEIAKRLMSAVYNKKTYIIGHIVTGNLKQPISVTEYFEPSKPEIPLVVGTVIEVEGERFVIARISYNTLKLVNIYGTTFYYGDNEIELITNCTQKVNGETTLSKEDMEKLLGEENFLTAKVVGCYHNKYFYQPKSK